MFQRKSKAAKVLLLSLIFVLISASMAIAQPLKADNMSVSIWPEYDEPGVLIVYNGEIRNTSSEPFDGRVVLNIPKGVVKAEMVCETEQGMLCLPYQIIQEEKYAEVSWTVSKPIKPGGVLPFMVEFYYDPLEGEVDKTFSYDFGASFDIDKVVFDVKEPFEAAKFNIEPVFDNVGNDNNGFTTYTYSVMNLAQGENQEVAISYTRESSEPSIDRSLVTGATTDQTNQAGGEKSLNSTTIILLVSFLALMGFFLFYALKGSNSKEKEKLSKKSKKKQSSSKQSKSIADEKKKIRKMLLDGKISEETYKELTSELEDNK